MFAFHRTRSVSRNRKIAGMVGAAIVLVLAAARVDTAAAYWDFADNTRVAGVASCVGYADRNWFLYFLSKQIDYGFSYPYTDSWAKLRVINTDWNTTAIPETKWLGPFVGMSRTITLPAPYPGFGRFSVQAKYGRVVGYTWRESYWEEIGVLNYPWGNLCF